MEIQSTRRKSEEQIAKYAHQKLMPARELVAPQGCRSGKGQDLKVTLHYYLGSVLFTTEDVGEVTTLTLLFSHNKILSVVELAKREVLKQIR